jgi:hypothetical protein
MERRIDMGEKVTRVERTTTTSATEPVGTPAEQTTTTTSSTTTRATTAQSKNVNINVSEGVEGATSINVPTTAPDEPTNINVNG